MGLKFWWEILDPLCFMFVFILVAEFKYSEDYKYWNKHIHPVLVFIVGHLPPPQIPHKNTKGMTARVLSASCGHEERNTLQ